MADPSFGQLFVAALGGGFTVKVLDIAYQEYRHWKTQWKSAEQFVDEHLDPLLKSADELVGKLRSLAEKDFKTIYDVDPNSTTLSNHDFGSLMFLFGRFWAQIEVIRQQPMSVAMAKDPRGLQLQHFFDCLESRRVRIIDRIFAAGGRRGVPHRQGEQDLHRFRPRLRNRRRDPTLDIASRAFPLAHPP
jgi:hypothetical protein